MKLEHGKSYRSRHGRVFGPMTRHIMENGTTVFIASDGEGGALYWHRGDGRHSIDGTPDALDLIQEVAPTVGGFQIDAFADADYQPLASILIDALEQAQSGKGSERHSDGKPFLDQPIMEIARMLGDTGGHAFQIMKKSQEANRMVGRGQRDAAVREFLGVINYAAAAILLIRETE